MPNKLLEKVRIYVTLMPTNNKLSAKKPQKNYFLKLVVLATQQLSAEISCLSLQ